MKENKPRFWRINPWGKWKNNQHNWGIWVEDEIIEIGTWDGDKHLDKNFYDEYGYEKKFNKEMRIKESQEYKLGYRGRYHQVRNFIWTLKKGGILIPYEKGGKIPGIGKVTSDRSKKYDHHFENFGVHMKDANWIEFKEPIDIKDIPSIYKVMSQNSSIRPLDDIKDEIIDLIKKDHSSELKMILSS